MYQKILVALENSAADQTLIPHIAELAKLHRSHLLLVHVADGWAARNQEQLKLAESEEMKEDQAYLENTAAQLRKAGVEVSTHLALGNPPTEILKTSVAENCDLIAMTSHGHRFLADIIYGSTIDAVRHKTQIPVLVVRAAKK